MNQRIIASLVTVTLSGCFADSDEPLPAPSAFIGALRSETLFPKRTPGQCETFFGTKPAPTEDTICISNSCGFGEAEFGVDTWLTGNAEGRAGILRYSIGEWCAPEFPVTREPMIVVVDGYDASSGVHEFRYERILETDSGERYFLPEAITEFAGVDLTTILRPLPTPIEYGNRAELSGDEVEYLLGLDFVDTNEETLVADKAVYVSDLTQVLKSLTEHR